MCSVTEMLFLRLSSRGVPFKSVVLVCAILPPPSRGDALIAFVHTRTCHLLQIRMRFHGVLFDRGALSEALCER